jgi:hypothetical protein
VLLYLLYWAIGVVVGCLAGWVLTSTYDWVKWNLTIEYMGPHKNE